MYRQTTKYYFNQRWYEPKEMEKLLKENLYKEQVKNNIIYAISLKNFADILSSAGEKKLATRIAKIAKDLELLANCSYFTSKEEKKQIKANKKISKYRKINKYDYMDSVKDFCKEINLLIRKTFSDYLTIYRFLPDRELYRNISEQPILFKIGMNNFFTQEECKAIVKNFKRALKKKELFTYELEESKGYSK